MDKFGPRASNGKSPNTRRRRQVPRANKNVTLSLEKDSMQLPCLHLEIPDGPQLVNSGTRIESDFDPLVAQHSSMKTRLLHSRPPSLFSKRLNDISNLGALIYLVTLGSNINYTCLSGDSSVQICSPCPPALMSKEASWMGVHCYSKGTSVEPTGMLICLCSHLYTTLT
jgi:hypothetical protein